MRWTKVEILTPCEFQTVLTQHEDDLYPVPAYRVGDEWRRETEGPEDNFYGAERHCLLYRTPTHWTHLPESPNRQENRIYPSL